MNVLSSQRIQGPLTIPSHSLSTIRGTLGVKRRGGRLQTFDSSREEIAVLLLSRKCGQSIVIGDEIVVTIVAVDRNRVQIGIKAPSYVPIFRQEIIERMVATGEIAPLACLEPPQSASV
jgi:carbon storage regulator